MDADKRSTIWLLEVSLDLSRGGEVEQQITCNIQCVSVGGAVEMLITVTRNFLHMNTHLTVQIKSLN